MIQEISNSKNYVRNEVKVDIYDTEDQYISALNELFDVDIDNKYLRTIMIYDTPIDEIIPFINIAIDRVGLGEGSHILAYLGADMKRNVVMFLCTAEVDLVLFNREMELEAPITFNSGTIHYSE